MNPRVWKIAPLLFVSGFCALVYQTAWLRELRLVFGASTAASAAVLAIFMGGLGLGSALLGKRADRSQRPLQLYAKLELGISLTAAASPLLIELVRALYTGLGGTVSMGLTFGTLVRLVLSAVVLAAPTVLMGGTLPAAAGAAESEGDTRRRALGVLYGVNTLGAVAGVCASTFLLLEVFGARQTLWLACLLNVLVAVVANVLSRQMPRAGQAEAPARAPATDERAVVAAPPRFVLAAAAMVGFVFLLMELVWYRMLSPLLGGSTFTFGLILIMALAGIGLGGAAYAAWGRRGQATLGGFALSCALEGLALGVPFALGDRLADFALLLRELSGLGFSGLVLSWSIVSAVVVFPAAFVSGIQFPLLVSLLGQGSKKIGVQVGNVYAFNTLGSIFGSLAGGFGVMPLLTAPGTWRLAVVLLSVLGVATLLLALRNRELSWGLGGAAASAALALVAISTAGPTSAWRHRPIGAGRERIANPSLNALEERARKTRAFLHWEAEGRESAVALLNNDGLSFLVNGKSDGNALADSRTQVMSGLVGALVHPHPKRALVVGLGTGSSSGWLGAIPGMERVDTVEIEPAILEVAQRCSAVNHHVLDNPKVHVFIGDAREVLLTESQTYDVIFSEPSNPYRSGIASLFTREFYAAARERLAEGGVFVQWLQAYEVDSETIRSAYATLASEFPYIETWIPQGGDMLLVGSLSKPRHSVERLRARIAHEPFRSAIAHTWGTDELEGVFSHFAATNDVAQLLATVGADYVSTDDLSFLEFAFARSVGKRGGFSSGDLRVLARSTNGARPLLEDGELNWERVEELRLAQALDDGQLTPPPHLTPGLGQRLRTYRSYLEGRLAEAARHFTQGGWEPKGELELGIVAHALAGAGDERALTLIGKLREYREGSAQVLHAHLLLKQKRVDEAAARLRSAVAQLRKDPWIPARFRHVALGDAVAVARQNKEQGENLFNDLREPLAVYAGEEMRLEVRLAMAQLVDEAKLCAEAFGAIEPHAFWRENILRGRWRCYELTNHPLRTTAKAELKQYLDQQSSPLLPRPLEPHTVQPKVPSGEASNRESRSAPPVEGALNEEVPGSELFEPLDAGVHEPSRNET